MVLVPLLFLAGCFPSAMILRSGRQETSVFNVDSTRQSIEKHLGPTVAFEKFKEPITDFKDVFDPTAPHRSVTFQILVAPNYVLDKETGKYRREKPVVSITSHATYRIKGRFVLKGAVGGANIGAGYTVGVLEIVQIPYAIGFVASGHDIMNVFDVWYDDGGRPLAYLWKQIDRDAKTPDEAPSTPSTVIPSAEVPVAPSAGASGR